MLEGLGSQSRQLFADATDAAPEGWPYTARQIQLSSQALRRITVQEIDSDSFDGLVLVVAPSTSTNNPSAVIRILVEGLGFGCAGCRNNSPLITAAVPYPLSSHSACFDLAYKHKRISSRYRRNRSSCPHQKPG